MMFKVFLWLSFVLSVSSSPVCKCEDGRTTATEPASSPTKAPMIVDFKLRVEETGEEYVEKIEIDEFKQTEIFNVPAHPGIDRNDVMHDFKLDLTLLRFPESHVCYLLPLDKEQPNPQKLMEDQIKAKGMRGTVPVYRKDTKWEITDELWDRSVLSDELAGFCAKYRIYHVKQIKDSLLQASVEEEVRRGRVRRQLGVDKICKGGMNHEQGYADCGRKSKKMCKVVEKTCTKYYHCPGMEEIEEKTMSINLVSRPNCFQWHIWKGIVCCQYVCE